VLYSAPKHRRPGGTLYRAVIKEVALPGLLSLAVFISLLLTQDLIAFSELMINRGLGFQSAASFIFFQVVPLVGVALPFATLVGCLIGLGRMGSDRELLALEASGVSSPRLLGPVLLYASGVCLVGLILALAAAPWSARSLEASLSEIARTRPGASLQAGVVKEYGEWKLTAREVSANGEELRGVLVWMPNLGETVFANRGKLRPDPGGAYVELFDGTVVLDPRKRPRQVRFESMTMRLPREPGAVTVSLEEDVAGFSLAALGRVSQDRSVSARLSRNAEIELNRRFALPFATLVLALLAVPLFFGRAHFSRAGGGVMAIVATVAYYALLQLGDGLSSKGWISPGLGVWLPNIVMGVLGLASAFRLTRLSSMGRHSDSPEGVPAAQKEGAGVHQEATGSTADSPGEGPQPFQDAVIRTRSRALPRYVLVRFLELGGVCFASLLALYFIVDLIERVDFLSDYRPNFVQFAIFYGSRLPLLASRVVPMALLLATALTVSLLVARGELVGMRANGIPAPVALAPLLLVCALVVPLYFLFNDIILPEANAYNRQIKNEVNRGKSRGESPDGAWYRLGHQVYEADDLDSREGTARNIIVYRLDETGRPTSRVDARDARHIGSGIWRLEDPLRVDFSSESIREVPVDPFASLGEGLEVRVDTRHLSAAELAHEIEEVESNGYDATAFRVAYFARWAAPLGCLILPAVALLFAVGGPPFPSAPLTIVMSVVAAVSFVLLTGVFSSLGNGGMLSPAVSAFAPDALFAGMGAALGFRLRNLRRR